MSFESGPVALRGPRHPVVYSVLVIPFGQAAGFASVTLAFLATQRGLTVEQGAGLVALSLFPQVWKFFWAPIADTTLSRRRWYLISNVFVSAGVLAMCAVPLQASTLWLMQLIVVLTSFASTFIGFAAEGFIAHLTPPHDRGRVSGWYQAGNLGGTGLGGGLGLWLLNTLPEGWEAGAIVATALLACGLALLFVPDVPAEARGRPLREVIGGLGVDLWRVIWSRTGFLCAFLCLVPVGTGSASGVLAQAEVAAHWHAGAAQVELVQGFLSGIVSIVGCIIGGYGCNVWGARKAYVIYGFVMAAIALGMAFLPATVWVYVVGGLAYAFGTGLAYAAFTGFVLDAIGAGNAATKYNAFASVSNTPIWYMGLVLAAVHTHFGPHNMLVAEAGFEAGGAVLFMVVAAVTMRRATVLAAVQPA